MPGTFLVAQTEISARPLEPALYLVATPIGNLGDITLRALETLAACDVLACEDTRVTRVLLDRYGIGQKPLAYHEHNAEAAGPKLIAALQGGKSVALVSDAGTPLVSDPGFRLVEKALASGIRVVPVPGPSAVMAALTASGLATDAFFFAGFPPVKSGQRKSRLEALRSVPGTLVFFESPRRLAAALADMAAVLGGARQAVVARELTKTFEEMRRGEIAVLAAHYAQAPTPRGEIVICVAPPSESVVEPADLDHLLPSLAAEMSVSQAAAQAAKMSGQPKQALYRRLLDLKKGHG